MKHAPQAARFQQNAERAGWHDQSLWSIRNRRDRMAEQIPEWESLRHRASQIKAWTMANLASVLEQLEQNATARGIHVHWAADAEQHNRIVSAILAERQVQTVVKSKSMLTEECGLNPWLESQGIEVIDTDLGERIVQLRGESPSHIVLPAIHIRRQEVGQTFHRYLGTPAGEDDPVELTLAARRHLRNVFLHAQAGITGVNFAIAETGGVVVCTNEGNADLGVALPKLHIACMGLEKVIPRAGDLSVFLRLLARSATGQPITTYSSHFHGPRPGGEMHLVIVDNGRSEILARPDFRRALHCIRCGACMNTCPVYRRSGGHSYSTTVPGPIGSILAPLKDPSAHASLPFACTLCGSCTDVCPVEIDLHHQLLAMRAELAKQHLIPRTRRWQMRWAAWILRSPKRYQRWSGWLRNIFRWTPKWLIPSRLTGWGPSRELPDVPAKTFRQLVQLKSARPDRSGSRSASPNPPPGESDER